ncbi:YbfB/YjiJ family MFS transporter [Dactylosporangium sp. NBC_01737]|uniref:YbfB/YjiJ family MFS transporter n=1 Tax=Dactylosporangium sp. NBC_01737 TaxID=2975959 RepID=UPI002E11C121|nr:YbfB/YjiJ family MFS transporter [Dactylosporangium sp. NBC_01737]
MLAAAAALAAAASWRAAGAAGAPAGRPSGGGPVQWRLSVVYVMFGAGYIAYMTFLSTCLASRHASLGLVCLTWTVLGLSAMAAPVLWSRPIAAWPGTQALAVLLATVAGAAALPLLSSAPLAVGGSAVLFGSAFMMVPAAVTALAAAARPPGGATGLIAALTVLFAAGQSAGPWASGWLADRTGPAAALWWAATLCAAAALLAATGSRPPHRRAGRAAPPATGRLITAPAAPRHRPEHGPAGAPRDPGEPGTFTGPAQVLPEPAPVAPIWCLHDR